MQCISLYMCARHVLFLYFVSQCIHACIEPSLHGLDFSFHEDLCIDSKISICIEIFDRQVCSLTNNMTKFITLCVHAGKSYNYFCVFYDCSSCSFTTAKSAPFSTAILHSNLNLFTFQACAYQLVYKLWCDVLTTTSDVIVIINKTYILPAAF